MGWWFGFGFHLLGLYWIGHAFMVQADQFAWLLPFAVTLLPAGLALFHALAAAATALVLARLQNPSSIREQRFRDAALPVVVLGLSLSATEFLRGTILTGFPWNVLGYALTWPLAPMQAAGVVGIYGLTLAVPIVFAWPAVILAGGRLQGTGPSERLAVALAPPVAIVGGAFAYGLWALSGSLPANQPDIRLRLVQPSIAQTDKWRADKQREIFEEHLRLSALGEDGEADSLKGITHVVWAEAAMPFMPLETPEAIDRIGRLLPEGTRLLAGALRRDIDDGGKLQVYNSLVVFGAGGRFEGLYDKIHLVPFGEYLPFGEPLEALGLRALVGQRGGFATGPGPRPLVRPAGLLPMVVLICYEAVFPASVIQGQERPAFLLNVTNDGWFGQSTGPYQHFHQSRLRAVEEGLPMIRVANNGVSGVIDGKGRIVRSLGLDEKGVIDGGLPQPSAAPPFAMLGNTIFFALWLMLALTAFQMSRKRSVASES
jgi:apolipoprotein N-acyltransferase